MMTNRVAKELAETLPQPKGPFTDAEARSTNASWERMKNGGLFAEIASDSRHFHSSRSTAKAWPPRMELPFTRQT